MRVLLLFAVVALASLAKGSNLIQIDVNNRWKFVEFPIKTPKSFDITFWVKVSAICDASLRLAKQPADKNPFHEIKIPRELLREGKYSVDLRLTYDGYTLCLLKGDELISTYYVKGSLGLRFIGVNSSGASWWRFRKQDFDLTYKPPANSKPSKPKPKPKPKRRSSSSSGRRGSSSSNKGGRRGSSSSNKGGRRGSSSSNKGGHRGSSSSNEGGRRGSSSSNKGGHRGSSSSNKGGHRGHGSSSSNKGGRRGSSSSGGGGRRGSGSDGGYKW